MNCGIVDGYVLMFSIYIWNRYTCLNVYSKILSVIVISENSVCCRLKVYILMYDKQIAQTEVGKHKLINFCRDAFNYIQILRCGLPFTKIKNY